MEKYESDLMNRRKQLDVIKMKWVVKIQMKTPSRITVSLKFEGKAVTKMLKPWWAWESHQCASKLQLTEETGSDFQRACNSNEISGIYDTQSIREWAAPAPGSSMGNCPCGRIVSWNGREMVEETFYGVRNWRSWSWDLRKIKWVT